MGGIKVTPFFFCPLWGHPESEIESFCARVAEAGFDGVEIYLPVLDNEYRDRVLALFDKHKLQWIAQNAQFYDDAEDPVKKLRRHLEWQVEAKPLKIDAHTGRDWFPDEVNQRFIDVAQEVSEASGIPILHEIHRSRFTFCAHGTRRWLERNPKMRLTADFSHWCTVAESLLEDQPEAVALAIERSDHIHARVGHIEGPQVNDPFAPEWKDSLDAHLGWWDAMVSNHRKNGTQLTITPEFGPFPYLPTAPQTLKPFVEQWTLNLQMLELLKSRYGE